MSIQAYHYHLKISIIILLRALIVLVTYFVLRSERIHGLIQIRQPLQLFVVP